MGHRSRVFSAVVSAVLLTVGVVEWHTAGAASALVITEIAVLPVVYVVWIFVRRAAAVRTSTESGS